MFPMSLEVHIFLRFLTASHKYVSEPQAFQNIQRCLVESRDEAGGSVCNASLSELHIFTQTADVCSSGFTGSLSEVLGMSALEQPVF